MKLAPLIGAALIYVACAAPIDPGPPSQNNIAPTGTGGSAGSRPTGSGGRTFVDAMVDPVPQAEAASLPTPPDIAIEECKLVHVPIGDAGTYDTWIAEHLYPGKTLNDLSALRTIMHWAIPLAVPGYENSNGSALIRDGAAAVSCGQQTKTPSVDRVTFILPATQ